MSAPSRDEVFAALRKQGIRPIKVIAKNAPPMHAGVRKRVVFGIVIAVAVGAGLVGGLIATHANKDPTNGTTETVPMGEPSTNGVIRQTRRHLVVAQPLARQRIHGNRERIETVPSTLFKYSSEAFLARFAEPGRKVNDYTLPPAVETNFVVALKAPVMVATDELTEYTDLKRIVAGMKREMSAYLAGGGTVQGYVAELVKRQKMELTYREKAEKYLSDLLAAKSDDATAGKQSNTLATAYAYWLKANASLQSMGIAPLLLPDELRAYQMSLDIDDMDGIPTIESRAIESPPVEIPKK